MEVAILSLNQKIYEITEKIKMLGKGDQYFAIPYKLWIFFLTDNETLYEQEKARQSSEKRNKTLKENSIQRFIRIWDKDIRYSDMLKYSLCFDDDFDAQYNDPMEEMLKNQNIYVVQTKYDSINKAIKKTMADVMSLYQE